MDINEIQKKYFQLSEELKDALSRMELSDQLFVIRREINSLQQLCPHSTNFSQDGECPYCGKRMG